MTAALRILFLFCVFYSNIWASVSTSPWYTKEDDNHVVINVELFLSSTCQHCHKADVFFREIEATNPWLHVQRYIINEDKQSLIRFNQLLAAEHEDDFRVPSIFFCNSRWIGFSTAETMGKDLLHGMSYCKAEIEKTGKLTSATVNVLKRWATATFFDSSITENPSAARFIITVALIDAFNPCALFCIAGFFALLFLQENRKKQVLSGLVFIMTVGVVHYYQQNYISTFFQLLPWFRIPAAGVGLFIFYMAGQYYRKRTTSNLLFLLSFFLSFMVQLYQQTCVMNWSNIFGQWLSHQQLTNGQYILYQFAYQSVYLVSLFIMLILYTTLIRLKLFAKLSQKVNTIGLLYIMAIGLFLIIYPLALSNLFLSLFILISLFIFGWFLNKYNDSLKD